MPDLELVILGQDPGGRFALDDGDSLIVGRESGCEIQIGETKASRRHCKVWRDGPIVRCSDLGSSNGTLVDGRRVGDPVTLLPGQVIQIGLTRIALVEQGRTPQDGAPLELEPTVALADHSAPSAGFRLLGLAGEFAGRVYALPAGEVRVGREASNTIQLEAKGISARHARLQVTGGEVELEDTSSNGTFVDGQRITRRMLSGGERVSFAAVDFRLERIGGPPASGRRRGSGDSGRARRTSGVRPAAPPAAGPLKLVLLGVGLIVALGLVVRIVVRERTGPDPSIKMAGRGGKRAEAAAAGSAEEQMVLALLKRHDYAGARELIRAHPGRLTAQVVALAARHEGLYLALVARLDRARATQTELELFGFRGVRVVAVSPARLVLSIATPTGGRRQVEYAMADLASSELLTAYQELELQAEQPLAFASYAGFLGQRELAATLLRKAFRGKQAAARDVEQVARELGWTAEQIEALTAAEPEPVSRPPSRQPPKIAHRVEPPRVPREDPRQMRRRILAEAGEILSLTRLFRYREAQSALRELIAEVRDETLRRRLEVDLELLVRERAAFEALLALINRDGIPLEHTPFEIDKQLRGKLASADEERYTIRLTQGRISDRWRFLGAERVMALLTRLPPSADNLLGTGIFAYERGRLREANEALIALYRQHPARRAQIDRYLAHRLGIAPPEGGFRPYKGRLVTPEEQEMRSRGLVRYQDRWVTPEDKQKLEAGFVQYKGQWVPLADKKLYEQGFLQYEGKWYAKAELNQIRSVWERAWERETPHYKIRSNMDHDFVEQVAKTLEAAYLNYKSYFGEKEPDRKMNALVFRTYEDWQRWCLEGKRKQLLGAAGVALGNENRFACWNKTNNKQQYFNTIVHEGAHLFFARSYTQNITSWYAEGMATYHESHRWEDNGGRLLTGVWNASRYYWLKRLIGSPDWLPLDKLMSGNALASINTSRKASMAFYSEAWGLFYFMNNTANKAWREGFVRFRKKLDGGFLNGVRGSQAARNDAAKRLFEQEVGPTVQVEAAMQTFFQQGPR